MSFSICLTMDQIRAIREDTGESIFEIKRRLYKESAIAALEAFRNNGDRETLCNILEYLIKEKVG